MLSSMAIDKRAPDPSASEVVPIEDADRVPSWMFMVILLALVVGFFFRPIFQDQNFIYRDAGHFYYPYFKLQIDEWRAGRIPLWNPYENGGEPLAGNPTASVFYPGKLIFGLPFPTAYKMYLLGHVVLAMLTCYFAARRLGNSKAGSAIGAISYAMGGYVLFQVYNIVFLIGAAWLPIGLLAVHRLVHQPTWKWAAILGSVLALQTLGGDPQVAQVTGIVAVLYALFIHLPLLRALLLTGCGLGLGAGLIHLYPMLRLAIKPLLEDGSIKEAAVAVVQTGTEQGWILSIVGGLFVVSLMIVGMLHRWWMAGSLGSSLRLIVLAGILSGGLSAIQILPTLEFTSVSGRASPDTVEETVAFSLFPLRLLECISPAVFGQMFPENARWFPFGNVERSIWIPTMYFGFIPFAFAISAMRIRSGSTTTRWLTWLTLMTVLLALGKFGGLRWIYDSTQTAILDPRNVEPGTRFHGNSDGLYWLAESTIPGFRQFRYPAKLLVFSALGMALLAAQGLSQITSLRAEGRSNRILVFLACLGISIPIISGLGWYLLAPIVQAKDIQPSSYGPFNPGLATFQFWRAAITSMVMGSLLLAWLRLIRLRNIDRSKLAIGLVVLTAVDVGVANHWLVLTDKQSIIDEKPAAIAAIEEYRQKQGDTEPYRIHRTRTFYPLRFRSNGNPERIEEQTRWERMTAMPKYALPFHVAYPKTEGTMNQYDIDFFFAPWYVTTPASLRAADPFHAKQMVYYPRRGYDIWNTRFFILPKLLILDDLERGSFTYYFDRNGKDLPIVKEWSAQEDDCVILENTEALPRAWIVHDVEIFPEIHHLRRIDRDERMEKLLYKSMDGGMPLWEGKRYGDYPIRDRAMVETDDPALIKNGESLSRARRSPSAIEPKIVRLDPDHVVIETKANEAGLLVLADAYFPGWSATVDGESTVILRTNRAMRGVLIPKGDHVVEFTYRSRPFEIGAAISAMTLTSMGLISVIVWRRGKRNTN